MHAWKAGGYLTTSCGYDASGSAFDPDDPEGEPIRVSAGGNLAIGAIAGSFQPREHTEREVDRMHWSIEYADGRWALRLTVRGAGGGDTQPLYMRTVAF
ncbi:MAG: hypothetical protein OXT09_37405 [Myxococcales bacterium]|nr:hypothetical protein [Myxococcales bacterium]